MRRAKPGIVPAEVRRAQKQFERWRAGKRGRERIPPRLWGAAAKLCGTYSIRRVSGWLRLNHKGLQDHAGRRSQTRHCRPKPTFVEWSPPVGSLPGSTAEYVVELSGQGDGTQRIHVRCANVSEVAALALALRDGGSGG